MRREKNKKFLLEKKKLADQKSPTPPSRIKWSAPYFCQF